MVVIAAFYIDLYINELVNADNFPSLDYEFITTSFTEHDERYIYYEPIHYTP